MFCDFCITNCIWAASIITHLHDQANIEQMSSKHQAIRAHVVHM